MFLDNLLILGSAENSFPGKDFQKIKSAKREKCFTGKVSVKNIMNQSCVLTRGQQVKSINGELNKTTFISTSPNWMKGCYVYENELLSSVLNDMVAEYNLVISGKSYDKRFTGKLQKDNLEKAVKVLFGSLGIEYSLTHKELKIE